MIKSILKIAAKFTAAAFVVAVGLTLAGVSPLTSLALMGGALIGLAVYSLVSLLIDLM